MKKNEDPRLIATRTHALDASLQLLQEEGVLAVTHASVSAATGISRSTLYRHWPTLHDLRNSAFLRAATSQVFSPKTNGPLKTDLIWLLGGLVTALNDTPWGQVAPQVVAAAATDSQTRAVINTFMQDRFQYVREAFEAAKSRGEVASDVDVTPLIEMVIAVPYFRKLIAGLPLDHQWLESHVDLICRLATEQQAAK
ncbi:MAG: TetR family transcriptional regulator [Rhizobiaceae bacterium]|nr:TetR family transcriptional regulator [Rhizobiaceae bacterium]